MEAITEAQKPRWSPELQITVSYMSSVTGAEGPGTPFCLKGSGHLKLLRNTKRIDHVELEMKKPFLIRINKVIVYGWVSWWHFLIYLHSKIISQIKGCKFPSRESKARLWDRAPPSLAPPFQVPAQHPRPCYGAQAPSLHVIQHKPSQ